MIDGTKRVLTGGIRAADPIRGTATRAHGDHAGRRARVAPAEGRSKKGSL
jgi:hypothetical protein